MTDNGNSKHPANRLGHSDLGLQICFGFRASDFGLVAGAARNAMLMG
jgi:hypothetical protein